MRQAQKIAAMVEMDVDSLENYDPWLVDDKEAFVQYVADWIFIINGEEDPNVKINTTSITPDVVKFFNQAMEQL